MKFQAGLLLNSILGSTIYTTISFGPHPFVTGHGFLLTPRSRNFVAKKDGLWSCNSNTQDCDLIPQIEDCPHCMNQANDNAQCGVKQGSPSRNYDAPKNFNGGPLPWATQEYYEHVGQEIDIEFVLTAHHKGHVEVYACPMNSDDLGAAPTQDCFDAHPLEFMWDYKYGAVKDAAHPNRVYVAPPTVPGGLEQREGGALYQVRMQLPDGVAGSVLLQWRYYTSNSCLYPGYRNYAWPAEWGSSHEILGSLGDCANPLPAWNAAPERFWNCAEIEITTGDNTGNTGETTPTAAPVANAPPTDAPVSNGGTRQATPAPTAAVDDDDDSYGIGNGGGACCRDGASGLKAANGCGGFVNCVNGVNHGYLTCPEGLLFNEAGSYCDWSYNVLTCQDHCQASTRKRRTMLRHGSISV